MGQEGSLARTHGEAPGLPRGRSSLPASAVRAAQRERLLAAVVAAVSEAGFGGITVAEIVRRAKVSRAAFYAHFTDKEECFLAATAHGGKLLVDAVVSATHSLVGVESVESSESHEPPGAPESPETPESPEQTLRLACRAFLGFLAEEPAFARVFYIDMPAAGSGAVARMDAAQHRFADLNRVWHERAREHYPEWPAVPYDAYLALAGAMTELVSVRVRHGRTAELPELEDTMVALHLAVLAGRPWSVG
jgi:AcrR family transcriptional regulator